MPGWDNLVLASEDNRDASLVSFQILDIVVPVRTSQRAGRSR